MENNNEITNILRRVVEINQKGGDLLATLTRTGLSIVDASNGYKSISRHYAQEIYFSDRWENSCESMVEAMKEGAKEIEDNLGGKEEC